MSATESSIHIANSSLTHLPPLEYEDNIRLLSFQGARTDGTLACSLEASTTDDSYYALSYVWGSSITRQIIICNGASIQISNTLYEALDQIWQQTPRRKVWADAICINQSDLIEKSVQVTIMGHIYYSAQEVIIWLGKQMDHSDVEYLFSCLTRRARMMRAGLACSVCGEIDRHLHSCSVRPPAFHIEACEQHQRMEVLLSKIRVNEWFRRIWTFQEICLAGVATVLLGDRSIAWEDLAQGLVAYSPREPHDPWLAEMKWIAEYRDAVDLPSKMRLASLLRATCQRKASEPRDKVYALLGLLRSRSYAAVRRIDYGQPVAHLYAEVTRSCFNIDDCVEILRYSWASFATRRTVTSNLPSWSVNWTSTTEIPDPYWARESMTSRRSFSPRRALSPVASDMLGLSVYFIAVGRLAEDKPVGQDGQGSTQSAISSWTLLPTCMLKRQICRSRHALNSATANELQKLTGMTIEIGLEDLDEICQAPSDNSEMISQLSRHDSGTCDCSKSPSIRTRRERQLWRGNFLQSQQAQARDWLGVIANQRGSMMSIMCALRPISLNSFRLIAWIENPKLVVAPYLASSAGNYDVHDPEESHNIAFLLTEISLV